MTADSASGFWARLERLLVITLVLAPPLFVWFWGFEGYVFPKRLLIAALAVSLGAVIAWRAVHGHTIRLELHPINGFFALWWLWNVLSILWAPSPSLAVERVVWLGVAGLAMLLVQHHMLGRPSFLVGRTLAGYRTWDLIRAVDYLASRPEVDPDTLGVTGNSGGGIMSLLIMAVDERLF